MRAAMRRRSQYITGIDGLRTLAVLGVIIYHLLPMYFRGAIWVFLFFYWFRVILLHIKSRSTLIVTGPSIFEVFTSGGLSACIR